MKTWIPLLLLTVLSLAGLYAQQPVGVLNVSITNVPAGEEGKIRVTGPNNYSRVLERSQKLENLADGVYEFQSDIIIQREPSISKALRLTNLNTRVTVKRDTQAVTFAYKQMPGSDKIWMGNQTAPANASLHIIAYADEVLAGSTTTTPATRLTSKATSIRSLAFDKDGNLWVADAGNINMYGWNKLGDTNVTPTITLAHDAASLAFDKDGNLWFTDGKKASQIMRIPKARLKQSGSNKTDIVLSGPAFDGAQSIAFDGDGNLWAANYNKNDVVQIPKNLLQQSSSTLSGLVSITCESKPPVINVLRSPKGMAFDRQGNLWVGYFGPNVIAQIPKSQLMQTAKITPDIQITLSVGVLLHQLAFDEDGSLYTALASGAFGKLTANQLSSGGRKAPDVVIRSNELKYGSGLAIYPLPKGFPIDQ
ncbi:MAG: hypothetical protein MUE95_15375 [Cyclobacteriaceae bacterium]|jgi:sugar lactone lactonase YvrE|nr:hypothetical protein [Cyclobacteriaceae bacterium]